MFRVHGSGFPKELWTFGPEIEPILVKYDKLRYRLLPYIYSVAWQVTNEHYTMMRPLVMDFGSDPQVLNIGDQFLFGPALMVNPVTEAGATSRKVYLPGRAAWTDFDTGKQIPAGEVADMPTPLDTLPLLVRAGSIIPLGPAVQSAAEKCDPIELRVYRGADGAFTLYDDDGETNQYERGMHATVPISWNEAKQALTIGARQGSFPTMLKEHDFHVVFVSEGHGVGGSDTERPDRVVGYDGQTVQIRADK
jgi:alpha-D-xyloside xylohydrolase